MGTSIDSSKLEKKLWLDVPPPEVRARIALHVSGGKHTPSALHLANVNERQREAVLASVPNILHISRDCPHPWAEMLKDELVALSFECYRSHHFFDHAIALLKAPRLKSVSIPDDPAFLRQVAKTSVSEVSLTIRGWASLSVLFGTLATLPIVKLSLFCAIETKDMCFNSPKLVSSVADDLVAACRGLTDLHVICDCPHGNQLIYRCLEKLCALTTVSIRERRSDSLELFSGVKSFSIQNATNLPLLANQLGDAVCGVLHPCGLLNSRHMKSLFKCKRLSSLLCTVGAQNELELAALLERSICLKTLAVFWDVKEMHSSVSKERCLHPSYAKIGPCLLSSSLSMAKNLRALSICFVQIPVSEVIAIFKYVGSQLHYFTTSILDQEDDPLDRLVYILLAAVQHCSALLEISLCERAPELALGIESILWGCLEKVQWEVLTAALSRLSSSVDDAVIDGRKIAEVRRRLQDIGLGAKRHHGYTRHHTAMGSVMIRPLSSRGSQVLQLLSRLKISSPKLQTEVLELMVRLFDLILT